MRRGIPEDFKERTAACRADTAPTAEELKLMLALNTTLNANFKDSKLQDAMDYLDRQRADDHHRQVRARRRAGEL